MWRYLLALLIAPTAAAAPPADPQAVADVQAGRRTEARAVWWGFDPADATRALQGAIDSGAARVIVDDVGAPWVCDRIQLAGDQELVLAPGVVVLARRGALRGKTDALLNAVARKNVTLTGPGATLRMWRDDYAGPDYEPAEWRHAVNIRSCTGVKITGLAIEESGGDGIYLGVARDGTPNTNVEIRGVTCARNHRQGISVISAENLLIEDCTLRETGGTAPMAGIDFEPNVATERLVNCVMRNCLVENNRGDGYLLALMALGRESTPVSIRLENCRSVGNRAGLRLITGGGRPLGAVGGRFEAVGCRFEGSAAAGVEIGYKPASACRVRLEDCTIAGAAAEQPQVHPIVILNRGESEEHVGGIELVRCTVIDPLDRLPLGYVDQGGGKKLVEVAGTLTVEHAGQTELHRLDQARIDAWFPFQAYREFPPYPAERFEPVAATAAPPSWSCEPRQRHRAEYLIWSPAGQSVGFTLRLRPVGKVEVEQTPVRLVDTRGKETVLGPAREGDTSFTFSADQQGAYRIVCEPGASTAQILACDRPVCLFRPRGPIRLVGGPGKLFFWVPASVAELAVKVTADAPGESVRGSVINAQGQKVAEKDNIASHQFLLARPTGAAGEIWSLQLDRPTVGVLEDHSVELQGVPPVLATSPAALLRPSE